jgi:hypothetical protein
MDEDVIVVEAERVEDLFAAPAIDPLAGRFEQQSGVENMVLQLRSRPRKSNPKVRFIVQAPTATTTEQVSAAVRMYFSSMAEERRSELQRVHRAGRQVLMYGLAILGVCLVLSTGIKASEWIPEFARNLFGEGFIIAGWVSLWRPLEFLIFDPLPLRMDLRLYEKAATANIDVVMSKQ